MKQRFALAVFSFLISCVAATAADYVRVTAEQAAIVQQPSNQSVIIATVAQGTVLEVVAQDGKWYQVVVRNGPDGKKQLGYVAMQLTRVASAPSTRPSDVQLNGSGEIQSVPRALRPVVMVAPGFEFTATPNREEMKDFDAVVAGLAALKGHDPREREKETQNNLGKAASSLMLQRMIDSGNFRVIDPAAIAELKANDTEVAKAKLLGAKYVVTGQITKFGKSDRKKGGTAGVLAGIVGAGGAQAKHTEYEIGITIRVVDTATSEVLASLTSDGVAVGNANRTIGGAVGSVNGGIGGSYGSGASGEREKRIAESIQASVDRLVIQLVAVRERGDLVP